MSPPIQYLDGYQLEQKRTADLKLKTKVAIAAPVIKDKFYYDIKIETMLPATLTYRVLAEDAYQAAELIKNMTPVGVKHRLIGRKDIKLSVYRAGSSIMEWMKNLIGG